MKVPMALDAHFSGFGDYREIALGSLLSLPATDGELPYVGQERNRPLQPIALHCQVSLAGELPNWVAESVLVTPRRESRKIYSDNKSVRSDSAIGSSSILGLGKTSAHRPQPRGLSQPQVPMSAHRPRPSGLSQSQVPMVMKVVLIPFRLAHSTVWLIAWGLH